jgi:type IV pilus assembly protein PilB
MAIAQRLARKLCDGTGVEKEIDTATVKRIENIKNTIPERFHSRIPDGKTMLHPEPTPSCSTGYKGRTAVTEVLEITHEIQDMILNNAPEETILEAARKSGFMTIQEDAMIKALNHEIPYEEMLTFGTQVGVDEYPEDTQARVVDNHNDLASDQAIIHSDEETKAVVG